MKTNGNPEPKQKELDGMADESVQALHRIVDEFERVKRHFRKASNDIVESRAQIAQWMKTNKLSRLSFRGRIFQLESTEKLTITNVVADKKPKKTAPTE